MNVYPDQVVSAEDPCFAVNLRQEIVYWNSSIAQLLGRDAVDVLGRSCFDVIGGRQADSGSSWCQRQCPVVQNAQVGQASAGFTLTWNNCWGRTFTCSVRPLLLRPVRDVVWIIHSLQDISAESELINFAKRIVKQTHQLVTGARREWPSNLTPREIAVLSMVARGMTTDDIASQLVVSKATAKNHIRNALSKLGLHSRLEAAAYVHENGLEPPPEELHALRPATRQDYLGANAAGVGGEHLS
jgi:DNA-binding CsgD family transcriptional regulator